MEKVGKDSETLRDLEKELVVCVKIKHFSKCLKAKYSSLKLFIHQFGRLLQVIVI